MYNLPPGLPGESSPKVSKPKVPLPAMLRKASFVSTTAPKEVGNAPFLHLQFRPAEDQAAPVIICSDGTTRVMPQQVRDKENEGIAEDGDSDDAPVSFSTLLTALGCSTSDGKPSLAVVSAGDATAWCAQTEAFSRMGTTLYGAELDPRYHLEVSPPLDLTGTGGWSVSCWFSFELSLTDERTKNLVLLASDEEDLALVQFQGQPDGKM